MMQAVQGTAGPSAAEARGVGTEQGVPADTGLLSRDEIVATLRGTLGEIVPGERLEAAAAALQEVEEARWEALPQDISPDMGYNFFATCRESCWLAREVLVYGATFRVFRQREPAAAAMPLGDASAPVAAIAAPATAPSAAVPGAGPRRAEPRLASWVLLGGLAVLLLLGLALWGASRGRPAPAMDEVTLRDVQAAVELADQHGQAMAAFGTRLVEHAALPAGQRPDAQAVVVHGAHWQADGAAMVQLAGDLRRALATQPPRLSAARSVEFDRLDTQATLLAGRGQALAEHGRAMEELVATVSRQVGESTDPWVWDGLAEMRRQSGQMVAAGQRLHAFGQTLQQATERLRRSVRG